MSQTHQHAVQQALDELSADDRAWLADRLEEHRELLEYLREH